MKQDMTPNFFFEGGRVLQRVFLMYGNLSDYYVTPSHCWLSFDRAIAAHLKHMGYECVLFFDGTDQLECADEVSARVRFEKLKTKREIQKDRRSAGSAGDDKTAPEPAAEKKPEEKPAEPPKPAGKGGTVGLGQLKGLGGKTTVRKPASAAGDKKDAPAAKEEIPLRFSVDTKDVPEYLDSVMRSKVKTAIIFCNCVSLIQPERNSDGVSMQEMAKKMSRWYGLPAENGNIAVMLFDVPRIATLHDTLHDQHMWNFLYERAFSGQKSTDAVIHVGSPLMDEIRCLLHDTLPEYVNVNRLPEGCSRSDVERAAQYCVQTNNGSLKALKMFIHLHPDNALDALLKEFGGVQEDALESIRTTRGWEAVYEAVKRIVDKARMVRGDDAAPLPLYSDTNLRMAYAASVNAVDVNLSMILQGNPGTGKTTVVKKIAKALYQNGLLASDCVHKVTRKDLVGEYVGHTAVKTASQIEAALGGVLFVDEAYSLYRKGHDSGSGSNDFGQEAIEVLLEAITNYRGRICIVLAGYPADMQFMLTANSGLPRRFDGNIVTIQDYAPELLEEIFLRRIEELNEHSREDRLPGEIIFRIGMDLLGENHTQDVADGMGAEPLPCLEMVKQDRAAKRPMPLSIFFNNWFADRDQKTFGNAGAARELADMVTEKAKAASFVTSGVITVDQEAFGEERQKLFINRQPSMDDLAKQLNDVIGLDQVKETLYRIVSYLQLVRAQEQHRMPGVLKAAKAEPGHYLFVGNPGTGKTMISEKLGIALSSMGLIGKYKPVRRTGLDLINTVLAPGGIEKLKEELNSCVGGVLVIDEAHQLSDPGVNGGSVVIKCLLDPMLEHAHDLCVVFCCYQTEVSRLLSCDDGLARRISDVFVFDDYNPSQITQIFRIKAAKEGYDPSDEILSLVESSFEEMKEFLENGSSAEKMLKEIKISIGLRMRDVYTKSTSLTDVVSENPELKEQLYQILPEDVTAAKERILRSMVAKRSGNKFGAFR
ncbi:MAG: AAA family ATPase [Clostridia bacterium]|nr:AAA family ATPase [Clostridia bacterium]